LVCKNNGAGFEKSYTMYLFNGTFAGVVNDFQHSGVQESVDYTLNPAAGQWYHLGYTFDSASRTQSLYVNGVKVAAGLNTNTMSYDSRPVVLGVQTDFGTTSGFFQGRMDEVSIYSRALTAAEMQSIFLAGSAGKDHTPPILTCPPNTNATCATW